MFFRKCAPQKCDYIGLSHSSFPLANPSVFPIDQGCATRGSRAELLWPAERSVF